MTITNLQEKENRKIWVPIRDGNRGGWTLFNWEDVRDMSHKDRQMYLGNSITIGTLSRGNKWRKRDWYLKTDKKYKMEDMTAEQSEAMKKDYERMNAALGYDEKNDDEKLTEAEMKQLMKKIKMKRQGYQEPSPVGGAGLGFDKNKVQVRTAPVKAQQKNYYRLQAINQFEQEPDNAQNSQPEKKEKKIKKEKKQKKKHKHKHKKSDKQKKHKKRKHKHRSHSRSRSPEKKQRKRKPRYDSSSSDSQ